jgi:hypothetical protein
MSVFNRCIETGNVLLILECWQDPSEMGIQLAVWTFVCSESAG